MTTPLSPTRRHAVLAALAAPALALPWPAQAVQGGEPAPDLALPGQPAAVRLADWRGRLVYVDFWASWCGPCRQSFPWMNDLQARLGTRGLQVLGVNLDARREVADRFLAQHPAHFALAFDPAGDSAKRFGIKAMPSSVLVGTDGRVLFTHAGFREEQRAELETRIAAALPAR